MSRSKGRPRIVGLKYCGGCRPNYDRVALVDQLRRRLGSKVVFVRHDHPGVELILAVQGCPTACADLTSFEPQHLFLITGPEAAEEFVSYILSQP